MGGYGFARALLWLSEWASRVAMGIVMKKRGPSG